MTHQKTTKLEADQSSSCTQRRSGAQQAVRIIPGERASSVCYAHLFEEEEASKADKPVKSAKALKPSRRVES